MYQAKSKLTKTVKIGWSACRFINSLGIGKNTAKMQKKLQWRIAQIAEQKWWKLYLNNKDVNEYRSWKMAYWNRILDMINIECPLQNGMHVLDVGCGPAGIYMNLSNCIIDAVDPLITTYEQSLKHFKREMYPHVTFHAMPFEKISIEKKYDVVFCINAVNHFLDIEYSYHQLVNAIKPGGRIVISTDAHNYQSLKHLFRFFRADILHPHQYDSAEYIKFLSDRGIKSIQQYDIKKEFIFNHVLLTGIKN